MKTEQEIRAKLKETNKKTDYLLRKPSLASFLIIPIEAYAKALRWVLEEDANKK